MSYQESIAKTIEEKITGEQRRYLLNELLKAIKKVVLTLLFLFFYFLKYARELSIIALRRKRS
jgi:hypothetical protein